MIPQRLTLKNFLSYREAVLDFRGIHTACIGGANGAGKSSLLEAIAWAIWGESRAATEDDVIHMGAIEAQVDFVFVNQHHTYRVIRSRHRGQASALEFQIAQTGAGSEQNAQLSFRSLTAKGVRSTQQRILEHIKLDYETFINSAYLRQGRADEFMLKRPSDRKQILADLLKLAQYDELAERAKDQARLFRGQVELLEQNLQAIATQLQQDDRLAEAQAALEANLAAAQQQQAIDTEQLRQLQATQQQRQTWQQQITWQQQQQRTLTQDCQRLQQEAIAAHQHLEELTHVLQQEAAIVTGYQYFQTLQAQEEILSARFKADQVAQAQRQAYHQQQTEQLVDRQHHLQQLQTQVDALLEQEAEIQTILSKAETVETALAHLHQARDRLHHLDQTQAQAAPLLQRRQQLLAQIDRNATRLTARLEDLQTSVQQLQTQQARQPQLQQAVLEVSDRIETLEQRRSRQQEVRERGMERRSFMERLQAHQRDYEAQLAEVEQKIHLLRQGVGKELIELPATGQISLLKVAETNGNGLYSLAAPRVAAFPPCPLCDRPLDEQHWKLVLEKHQIEQEETLQQIWGIREQLSASEREIQVMRQEYIRLEKELMQYGSTMERRGQLQAQLQQTTEVQTALQQVIAETATLERSLQTGDYARELQEELQLLDRSLQQLDYDERDHALARGEVDRWRWAEIKHAEIRQAQRKQAQIAQQLPQLQSQITQLQTVLTQLQQETATHLAAFDQHLSEIGYDVDRHEEFRQAIRQAQPWQLHQQELHRAQQIYPQIQQRSQELTQALQERQHHLQTVQTQTDTLVQQLEQLPDRQTQIHTLEQQIQQRRSHLDQQLAHLGRLQQQQQQQATLTQQQTHLTHQRQLLHRKLQVYQELTQAFGKNGIQTLMIENVLPQLEAETNQILSRLSANQLHVQFVTQRFQRRESRVAKLNSQPAKAIETLDILIADAQGTRPYETYSGGEAFRVNFAIRLALSRLLAQRSGTSLQMLIIDEGFGTQDAEGCDRLIAAINAIAPDFACILAVTHVPHLKEAFQSRIEVYKTANGSQLTLSV